MKTKNNLEYRSPKIEIVYIPVEEGFCTSGQLESLSYQDGSEDGGEDW